MNKPITILAVILGIILLIVSAVYFIEPARSLPSFFPGYDKTLTKHHLTHAIGVLILAIACFVFGWFQSGKKSTHQEGNKDQPSGN